MAIIPFGLVGAIWGHYIWDVPLCMFSIVGLIGMVGIIINDSIVLVTTIDEYARDRGVMPGDRRRDGRPAAAGVSDHGDHRAGPRAAAVRDARARRSS